MKAAKFNNYGSYEEVLLEDVNIPSIEKDKVLVKIHAASINMLDVRVVTGNPEMVKTIIGLPKPKLNKLGSDFSGVVVEVGEGVTEVKIGDEVFGQLSINQDGTFAEYALVPKEQLALKPKNVSHVDASTLPMAGNTALQGLRLLDVKEGTHLLVYGASGGVGTFVVQIAKALGAHVTAVCSTRNIENAKLSNADTIIDYKSEDWYDPNIQYDAIYLVNGYNPFKLYISSVKNKGKILLNVKSKQLEKEISDSTEILNQREIEVNTLHAKINKDDYNILANMLSNNDILPIIDKEFNLLEVRTAFQHFMSGNAHGKTVIKVN